MEITGFMVRYGLLRGSGDVGLLRPARLNTIRVVSGLSKFEPCGVCVR